MEKESMHFDVIIVGAGPAGLSAAIKLKQLAKLKQQELSVCILEKGAEVGSHIISGAVIETRALSELIPNWQDLDTPLKTQACEDEFLFLTANKAYKLPTPPSMHNQGNFIVSLANLCRWLGNYAEGLEVDIFPGFPASDILYDDKGCVIGVSTGNMGVDKDGNQSPQFQAGMNLYAKQTLFAEGCRGALSQRLIKRFELRGKQNQTYGIGLKEVWRIPKENHMNGKVVHTIGWPLDHKTYGGSFLYHFDDEYVSVGYVVGLDYNNPWLSPFEEFQRFKTHPKIKPNFNGGERIAYGARAINEGGYQSIPRLSFPGGALIGDAAGFVNVAKIKGTHTAMKSGMIAAEQVFDVLNQNQNEAVTLNQAIDTSWVGRELYSVRNLRPSFSWGLYCGLMYSAFDHYVLRGKAPWTFKHHADHTQLISAQKAKKIDYPKPDNKLTFDRLSSLYLSGTHHIENQPCHLVLKDKTIPIDYNLKNFAAPETRYCPAGVYEIIYNENKEPYLQINAQNCLHCKTCDIKDPKQNIVWISPEGGGGPNYQNM